MNKRTRKPISYYRRKQLYGYAFISLWLIGLFQYFLRPMVNIVRYSLNDIVMTQEGYYLENFGIQHFNHIFRVDPNFMRNLALSIGELLYQVPVIVVFSIFIALMLNQRFKGRTVMRAIFFIPVIVASGVIINIISGDMMSSLMRGGQRVSGTMLRALDFSGFLFRAGLPSQIILPVMRAANDIFDLSWRSGVQILILLAGLQTVPPSLYEAASLEGATGWEKLWKITIPMISPMIVLVVVYTTIDAFVSYDNWLMRDIVAAARRMEISRASTMAFSYFTIILVIVAVVYILINKHAYYLNDDKENNIRKGVKK